MKILVRQISTGLYWNSGTGWGRTQDAEVFPDSAAALLYCIRKELRDVHVILRFDDPAYDVVLHPFGERGHDLTSMELIEQSRRLKEKSDASKDRSKEKLKEVRDLLAGAHQTAAAMKEARKQLPFAREQAGEEQGSKLKLKGPNVPPTSSKEVPSSSDSR